MDINILSKLKPVRGFLSQIARSRAESTISAFLKENNHTGSAVSLSNILAKHRYYTDCRGKYWKHEEYATLLILFLLGKSVDKIAVYFQRTVNAIVSQLSSLGCVSITKLDANLYDTQMYFERKIYNPKQKIFNIYAVQILDFNLFNKKEYELLFSNFGGLSVGAPFALNTTREDKPEEVLNPVIVRAIKRRYIALYVLSSVHISLLVYSRKLNITERDMKVLSTNGLIEIIDKSDPENYKIRSTRLGRSVFNKDTLTNKNLSEFYCLLSQKTQTQIRERT